MKITKIVLIIISILTVLIGIRIYNNNKELKYTLRDIQQILKKSDQLTNNESEINLGIFKYYKRKDNKIFLQSDVNQRVYRDYDKNKQIVCKTLNNKNYYIEQDLTSAKVPSSNLYISGFEVDELLTLDCELLSVKKQKYNKKNCLKVELKNKEENEIVFWIDIDTGLILKCKSLDEEIVEFIYEFDTVTDEEVTHPDLSEYKKIEPVF